MADEILKIDQNNKNASGAVTDNAAAEIRNLRIDDATKGLKVMIVGGGGGGTVTSITAGTGLTATAVNPIVASGTIALDSKLAPLDTLGTAGQLIRVNAGATALEYFTSAGGIGTVTTVSVATANGFSGTVANATTTPAITIIAGAITPTSVNGLTLTALATGFTIAGGTVSKTLTVPLDASVSGTNTGDNTLGTGVATALAINIGTSGAVALNTVATLSSLTSVGTITTGGLGTGATLGSVTVNIASSAVGDLHYLGASNVLTRLADVAAGQPLLSGGVTTAPAYAGYTFSGTAAQTYTFPTTSKTLMATDISNGSFASSALATALSDETGTGVAVFNNKPTFLGTIQTITAIGALAFDGSTGNMFTKTISGIATFTQSNFSTGQNFIVKVTGAFTITWFSGITWINAAGAVPTQGAITSYGFTCTGSNTFDGYLVGSQ